MRVSTPHIWPTWRPPWLEIPRSNLGQTRRISNHMITEMAPQPTITTQRSIPPRTIAIPTERRSALLRLKFNYLGLFRDQAGLCFHFIPRFCN